MKRITLATAYLTVVSSITFAQLSSITRLNTSNYLIGANKSNDTYASAQQSGEDTQLNNMPLFPGGQRALQAYFENPGLYPDWARQTNVSGRVGVLFRVMPSGYLTELRIVQSRGALLDQAALNAVASMPRWYPAHREGVAVSCLYQLFITFDLEP